MYPQLMIKFIPVSIALGKLLKQIRKNWLDATSIQICKSLPKKSFTDGKIANRDRGDFVHLWFLVEGYFCKVYLDI